jgi:hypothetical protein
MVGRKQTANHIEKRKRFRDDHHAWKGDAISNKGGRKRALLWFKPKPCEMCGSNEKIERHHRDENPKNNDAENIQFLCRACHLKQHDFIKTGGLRYGR